MAQLEQGASVGSEGRFAAVVVVDTAAQLAVLRSAAVAYSGGSAVAASVGMLPWRSRMAADVVVVAAAVAGAELVEAAAVAPDDPRPHLGSFVEFACFVGCQPGEHYPMS